MAITGAYWLRRVEEMKESIPSFVCVARKLSSQTINANEFSLQDAFNFGPMLAGASAPCLAFA